MTTIRMASVTIAGLSFAACSSTPTPPARTDTQRIIAADTEPGSWLTHGRTYGEQRFSPLTKVSTDTVGGLGLAWTYEMRTNRGASGTPLVVDGVMYVTSAWSLVYALDAVTGQERWVYDPKVDRAVGAKACCDVVNRGVAVSDGKVFVGVIDGRLVALDAKNGSVVWETITVDQSQPYTITGAPRSANGLVYIGNGGAEYGVRGYVSAYDANSGKLAWRFYTVPGDPSKGADGAASDPILSKAAATWNGQWWKLGGGGTVWDAIVYDDDSNRSLSASATARRGTSSIARQAAETTGSSRPSSRSMRQPVPISGTTRRRPARPGITPPPNPSSSPRSPSTGRCGRSRCRLRRTGFSTSSTGRPAG